MPNDYKLYEFQTEGVSWILSRRDNGYGFAAQPRCGLIADEMGLGKTAQALEAIADLVIPTFRCSICKSVNKRNRGVCRICKSPERKACEAKRILFIVPGATIIQWQRQFDRWINECEPDEFGLTSLLAIRGSKVKIPKDYSIVISHGLLAKKKALDNIIAANFDGIVIDEIHKFGSTGTKRIKHLWALINLTESKFSEARIGLSGTPVRNYAKEIYNIAHFIAPETFRNEAQFNTKYLTYDKKALWNPQQFHLDFSPYYIRRTVSQVQKNLPAIRRTKLYTEITDPFIISAYNKELDLMSNAMIHGQEKLGTQSILGYLVRLRHITGIAKAKESAIIEPLRDYLTGENGIESQRKIVIGIHHRFVATRLMRSLPEFKFYMMRGGMSDNDKDKNKQDFINHKGAAIMLLSIKAAGEGVDGLQFAESFRENEVSKAMIFERQWNGQDELQFEKRLHRTGQTLPVQIEYTIAINTVDEFFDQLIDEKLRYTTQVEDINYATNPAFLKSLAERVIASRLPSSQVRTYDDIEDDPLESIRDTQNMRHEVPASRTKEIEDSELNDLIHEVEWDILKSGEPEGLHF